MQDHPRTGQRPKKRITAKRTVICIAVAAFAVACGGLAFELFVNSEHLDVHSAKQVFNSSTLLGKAVHEALPLREPPKVPPFRDVVIIVPSHWSEVDRRCGIRDSWLRYFASDSPCAICRKYTVEVVFLVGNAILDEAHTNASELLQRRRFLSEAQQYGDVIALPDFAERDKYRERSTKTLKSMKFALQHFRFRLLLKTDTDSYVFGDRLLELLAAEKAFEPGARLYIGNFEVGMRAKVVTSEHMHAGNNGMRKWLDSTFHNLTGLEMYPVHAKGPGYLLSYDLVEYLANPLVPFVPFTCEDTAVGAYLMATEHKKVQIPVKISMAGCEDKRTVIDHYVGWHIMRRRWRRFEVLGDACLASPPGYRDPVQGVCSTATKSYRMWRMLEGFLGPEVDGMEVDFDRAQDHGETRCGVCAIAFEWRAAPWGDCVGVPCGGGEMVRCLQCVGTDGEIYDEWECPYGDMPERARPCEPLGTAEPCGPLYRPTVRNCLLKNASFTLAASKLGPMSVSAPPKGAAALSTVGMLLALRLTKRTLDRLQMPIVLDPFLVTSWSETCELPSGTPLTVFVLYRYIQAARLLDFERQMQELGMVRIVSVRHDDHGIGYMAVLNCPVALCGEDVLIQVKVAGEEDTSIWWPRWTYEGKGEDKAPEMEVCRSPKPLSFGLISIEREYYLEGHWPPNTTLVCEALAGGGAVSAVAWLNEDNVLDVFLRMASPEVLATFVGTSNPRQDLAANYGTSLQ